MLELIHNKSHLKISGNIKCHSSGGVNHVKNWEVKTESQHPGAKNNDESRPRIWMGTKPFKDSIAFK